jgi:hypothetical protein
MSLLDQWSQSRVVQGGRHVRVTIHPPTKICAVHEISTTRSKRPRVKLPLGLSVWVRLSLGLNVGKVSGKAPGRSLLPPIGHIVGQVELLGEFERKK